jgi:L-lactate dehydrogenase complex protein LldG
MVESTGEMIERDTILGRIREALRVTAYVPGGAGLPTTVDRRRVLPAAGATFDERAALFARNAGELTATFNVLQDAGTLAAALGVLRDAEGWTRVAAHRGELAGDAARSLGLPLLFTDGGYDRNALERCDVGISECDALVAQTGTVVVTSRSAGGRALSCLPPHHVVLARREQLVADLPAAFQLVAGRYGADYPSVISFITGPSRTADIERSLVLGAHGPKRLTIFMV